MQYAAKKRLCLSADGGRSTPRERPPRVCHAQLAFSLTHGTWSPFVVLSRKDNQAQWGLRPYAQQPNVSFKTAFVCAAKCLACTHASQVAQPGCTWLCVYGQHVGSLAGWPTRRRGLT